MKGTSVGRNWVGVIFEGTFIYPRTGGEAGGIPGWGEEFVGFGYWERPWGSYEFVSWYDNTRSSQGR